MNSTSRRAPINPEHQYNDAVLEWSFEDITTPMQKSAQREIAGQFSTVAEHHQAFIPLIWEETRAILSHGLEMAQKMPKQGLVFQLKSWSNKKKQASLEFKCPANSKIRAGEAILIQDPMGKVSILGLAKFSPDGEVNLKIAQYNYITSLFKADAKWTAHKLGSLITLRRMFKVCSLPELSSQLDQNLAVATAVDLSTCAISKSLAENYLNNSQTHIIDTFARIPQGISLLQGPPGTGKTTTTAHLLMNLYSHNSKTHVCAPSNKAIQNLLERFTSIYHDKKIILVGAKDKIAKSTLAKFSLDAIIEAFSYAFSQISVLCKNLCPQQICKFTNQQRDAQINAMLLKGVALTKDFENATSHLDNFNSVKYNEQYNNFCAMLDNINAYTAALNYCNDAYWKNAKNLYAKAEQNPLFHSPLPDIHATWAKCSNNVNGYQTLFNDNRKALETEILQLAKIVFSTLSTAGQDRLAAMGTIDTLIVDEAGQSVEAETLIPMQWKPKKCLLIGDIKQLPATVISQDAVRLKFGRSLMERFIDTCRQPYSILDTQYRMHPQISSFPNARFYAGRLKNAPSVCDANYKIKGLFKYAFVDVPGIESRGASGTSYVNLEEAKTVASAINYLRTLHVDIQSQVSVISFYADQVDLIYKNLKDQYPNIKVKTVDSYQGGESDIVLISCVRANQRGDIGFVKDPNRLNVALTRARQCLMVLGNLPTLRRSKLKPLIKNAVQRNVILKPAFFEARGK